MSKKIDLSDKQLVKLNKAIHQADASASKVCDITESMPFPPPPADVGDEFSDDVKKSALEYAKQYAKWVKKLKTAAAKLKDAIEY